MGKQNHIRQMRKASGTISVEKKRMVVNVSHDFVRLYYWFISKKYWIRMNLPLHGSHITIFNEKFSVGAFNKDRASKYHGQTVEFEYDVDLIRGGQSKGFLMFYIKVHSPEIENIKKDLEIWDGPKYRGLHITVCNSKGDSVYPDWPKMIEIKK